MAEKVEFEKGIGKRSDYVLWRDGYRYVRNKTIRNEFGPRFIGNVKLNVELR